MLVSLLPYDPADAGLTSGQNIIMKAKAVSFIDIATEMTPPVLPAASAPPDGKASLTHLSTSVLAMVMAFYLGFH